ncbi:thiosulfate oxidation carrier protein SoxY [Neptuniibacter sp. QD48_11]|uniref:thiosulfate oxidation carrier protein SoxY n=1 Tax=unclassified Neptuniibacter TaxID=2630693 RepID=UPI0039F5C79C
MGINRRSMVKVLSLGGAMIGAGVLMPRIALATWKAAAFEAQDQDTAIKELLGGTPEESADVILKTPDTAENGAIVPVTVRTSIANVESISIYVKDNPAPLAVEFKIPEGTDADVSTRVRMAQSSRITAVVKAEGKLYSAAKDVTVTVGGCG